LSRGPILCVISSSKVNHTIRHVDQERVPLSAQLLTDLASPFAQRLHIRVVPREHITQHRDPLAGHANAEQNLFRVGRRSLL